MEGAMAVRVTAAHTAEAPAEAGREAGEGAVAAVAAALAPSGFLGLPAPFSEEGNRADPEGAAGVRAVHPGLAEARMARAAGSTDPPRPRHLADLAGPSQPSTKPPDEDDVHRCGRCQAEFTALEDFVQHKIQKVCQRAPPEALPAPPATTALLGQEVVPAAPGPEEPITVAHIVVEAASLAADISHASDLVGGGHIKEVIVAAEAELGDGEMAEAPGSPHQQGLGLAGEGEQAQVKLLVNKDGRYVCALCHKTFKTGSILKAHMVTHSSRKDHECKLCGASFRTKGSLIRHHRRHTDERPYKCSKCGKSFRESGALTRHLKSLTPCTEKIRFSVSKDVVVSKEDAPAGSGAGAAGLGTVTSSVTGEPIETSPVIHLVTDAKGTVIHEVHVQMQELPLGMKALAPEVASEASVVPRTHPCPQCSETFPTAATLEAHKRGHTGPRPFACAQCGKAFPKAYLLKKHQEVHVRERRFRCGDCGKLYKTIAHVRGHRRVHSDERPYPCPECGKRYKTKNAQQVHFRTHLEEKPHVCQFCSRGFREKGSLVRHVRHHTGEKPFKCYKCGRGFAEHGTLNRHLRTKGGCLLEVEELLVSEDSPAAATTVLTEDPHTVLVEFSSVVADTQEYIIEATADDAETSEATEIIEGTQTEVDSHIMKVVQQIVHQASTGHQIIVQNVTMDEETALGPEAAAADTITIATPESLTEQVAMTLASAISEGTVLAARAGTSGTEQATVTMVSSEDIEILEHAGELVIASPEGQLEVQTVIV
ncbi:transcription factor E4F1 isoform X4 [Gorilla gorilla gorilla]|uniref:transcription factor E4F1 isoform X4 n=1 Tax=Gorilla gorilla gorilla TaxID=9595 RepID=UPI002445DB5D|nr:transcription factor E4F1 isoform X4 [Gorilla gorilla gorilla]